MAVALQIRKITDRIAKGVQSSGAVWAAGTSFWALVDGAANETFENRVKGQEVTDFDTALTTGIMWRDPTLQRLFTLLDMYAQTDLGLTGKLDAYLTATGFRVPYGFAEAYYSAKGSRLSPINVFAKGTMVADTVDPSAAGLHLFGTWNGITAADTFTAVDGALDTDKIAASPIAAISREATVGGSSPVVTVTLQDNSQKDISLTASASAFGQVVIGEQAITGVSGATISCAATGQFKVGEKVLLWENADGDTSLREVGTIATINANTSIVLSTAPVNTFTTAGKIRPMFTNVIRKSGTFTDGKHVDFYAVPDRIIAL